MNRFRRTSIIIGLFILFGAVVVPATYAALDERGRTDVVEFDVAEDGTRFIFNKDITFEDGLPADGSNFITRGYLYPKGTLACTSDGCNGLLITRDPQDQTKILKVEPEFPDKVLGEWVCEGYMINDAAHATTGKWVVSTQLFEFKSVLGPQQLVTNGYELADFGVPIARAITGGTSFFSNARGSSEQTLLGFNPTMGATLRVTLNPRIR
jgi:hypothetical protein